MSAVVLCALIMLTEISVTKAVDPVVRYTQETSFSIPFNVSTGQTGRHQAVLWQRGSKNIEWKLVQAIPARIGAFEIDAPQNGRYRFAVTTSTPASTLVQPDSQAGELLVIVDNRHPAVSLSIRNGAWRSPQLECLIAESNPDLESIKLRMTLADTNSVIDIPCQPQLVRQQESGIWHCHVPLPRIACSATLTYEIKDLAGNKTVEEFIYTPSTNTPAVSAESGSNTTSPDAEQPAISFDLASSVLSGSDESVLKDGSQQGSSQSAVNKRLVSSGMKTRTLVLSTNDGTGSANDPIPDALWKSFGSSETRTGSATEVKQNNLSVPMSTGTSDTQTIRTHSLESQFQARSASLKQATNDGQRLSQNHLKLPRLVRPAVPRGETNVPVPLHPPLPPLSALPAGSADKPGASERELLLPDNPTTPAELIKPQSVRESPKTSQNGTASAKRPVMRSSEAQQNPANRTITEFDILLRSARNNVTTGHLNQALSQYDRCLELNPLSSEAARERTLLLARIEPAAAVPHLRNLIARSPSDYDAAHLLSRIYMDQGQHEQSLVVIDNALKHRADDIRLRSLRVQSLVAAGRIQSAMSALDELSMDESNEQPNYSSASFVRSLVTLQRMNEAITEARTLYENSPLNSEYGFLLAESLATNNEEQEAIGIVSSMDSDDPDFSSRVRQLIRLAIEKNLLDLAELSLNKARENSSDNTDLTELDVALSLARRDYRGAELRISTAPDQWKNDDLLMARAKIQMELGLYAEAETVLGQLSKEAENSVDASLLRAELYSRFQAYDLAEEALAGGLSQHPANRRLQNTMARMYIAAGKPDLAIGITESLFETDPLNADAWTLWAVAHTENKSTTEAEMRLAAQDPNSIHFQLHKKLLQVLSAYFKADQHNYPGALTEFELTNFPNDPTRYPAEFGYAYYQCLVTCRSQTDAQQFLIRITDNVPYSINLTRAAQRQNDFLLAKQILLSIAAEQSGDPGVLDALGQILILTDGPAAEGVFNDIIAMQPTSVPGRHGLAIVKWRQREFETALMLLDSLISDSTHYRPGLRDRARLVADWKGAVAAMPEYDKAEQALRNPISSSAERALLSDSELLRSELGYRSLAVEELFAIRLEKQARFLADWRPDNATATLRRLQQIRPQDSMVAFLLAEQNLRMGRYRQAEFSLLDLLIQDPENPQVQSAIRYTQKQLQPTLNGEFTFFDQSGRNGLSELMRLRFGSSFSRSIGTGNNILSVGYRHIQLKPPTDYDGLQLVANATQALAGAEANVEAANQAFIGLVPGTPAFQQAVDDVNAARAARDNAENTLGTANAALIKDTLGNALQMGLHLEPNQNLTVDFDLAAEFYDSGFSSRPVFQLRAVQRVMDGFDAGFSTFLANVAENSESIRQDIFRYGAGPEFRWQATSRWTLQGRSRVIGYSDDNLLYEFDLNNEVVLYSAPHSLTAILRFHGEQFSEETVRNPVLTNLAGTIHPYFAPSDFAYFTGGLRWRHLLSRLALGENELSYSVRCLAQWDNLGVLYGIVGGSFDWDATNNLTLSLNFDSINSSEYDAVSALGAFIWYLP